MAASLIIPTRERGKQDTKVAETTELKEPFEWRKLGSSTMKRHALNVFKNCFLEANYNPF